MLPRHVRRASFLVASYKSTQRSLSISTLTPSSARIAAQLAYASQASRSRIRTLHSSSRRQNELPKSPFQTFVDTLREELQKNRELQENVKQLQGDVDKFQDSEAMKKARAAYERARVSSPTS